jgi:nucleoside-diphosphate-sugar epimerase
MPKYLVTGVAGFIGRSIAAALIGRGDSVRGIDNFLTGKPQNLAGLQPIDFIEGDLTDYTTCIRACTGVETVFHHAALASVARSVDDPLITHANCVNATLNLLEAARRAGVRRVVFAGSSSVYGETSTVPKHEEMLSIPISPYAASKLACEVYMNTYTRTYKLETVVLRYFNVFGPYQDASSDYSGVIATFCQKMLAGEQPTIYGDGKQSRDFTYIENIVNANLLAALAPSEKVSGRVINVAMGQEVTLNELFKALCDLTGYKGRPAYAVPRSGDIRRSVANISLARELMGYEPTVDFHEGICRTVNWYKSFVA